MSNLYHQFWTLNQSFKNDSYHHYLHVDEKGKIFVFENSRYRSPLKKIVEATSKIIEDENSISLLKEMHTSLRYIQKGILCREKLYPQSYQGMFFNSFIGRIIAFVINFFGFKQSNYLKELSQVIHEVHSKMTTLSSVDPTIIKKNRKKQRKKELINLGGVQLQEHEWEKSSVIEGKFGFFEKGDHFFMKTYYDKTLHRFHLSLEGTYCEEDILKKVKLILELHQNKNILIVPIQPSQGIFVLHKKELCLSFFIPEKKEFTHLRIYTWQDIQNISNENRSNFQKVPKVIDLPLDSCHSEDLARILESHFINKNFSYYFNPIAFISSMDSPRKLTQTTKLTRERLKMLLTKYVSDLFLQIFAWPTNEQITIENAILTTYEKGIIASSEETLILQPKQNEQFILLFRQIFAHIDELDKTDKATNIPILQKLCTSIANVFLKCNTMKIQEFFALSQTFDKPHENFGEDIFETWINFKEAIFDKILLEKAIKPNRKANSIDVHLRSSFIQAYGNTLGLSPLLIACAMVDERVNENYIHRVPNFLNQYYKALYEAFPNFVQSIALKINSSRLIKSSNPQNEDMLEASPFLRWKEKQGHLPHSFGFHLDKMPYADQFELSEKDRMDLERQDQREQYLIPHISLTEVYQIMHEIGIISLENTINFISSKAKVHLIPSSIIEIELGQRFYKLQEVDEIAWPASANKVFIPGEAVIMYRKPGYWEYAYFRNYNDEYYWCYNGSIEVGKEILSLRKLKNRIRWSKKSEEMSKSFERREKYSSRG